MTQELMTLRGESEELKRDLGAAIVRLDESEQERLGLKARMKELEVEVRDLAEQNLALASAPPPSRPGRKSSSKQGPPLPSGTKDDQQQQEDSASPPPVDRQESAASDDAISPMLVSKAARKMNGMPKLMTPMPLALPRTPDGDYDDEAEERKKNIMARIVGTLGRKPGGGGMGASSDLTFDMEGFKEHHAREMARERCVGDAMMLWMHVVPLRDDCELGTRFGGRGALWAAL